ncbi:GNAT family N-acetyltransferase [Streptomyces sp. NPDC047315]|uniref:GNAT family N-acetyltransferase n=1 Tax=Streptomyces sp. NPDC047315 TaxID=3155142 RepID=UPI0033F1032B
MTVEYRTARRDDEIALSALWATAFAGAPVEDLWAAAPERHRHTLVAVDDGHVVSALHHQPRPLRSATGAVERVGCVGSVATLSRARGRGHVRALLAAAVRAMTADGCAWSLLFTDTPGVYEGEGWRTFSRPTWHGPPAGETSAPRPGHEARVRTALAADRTALAALHDAYDAHRPLTTVRTADDWAHRVPTWYAPATTDTLLAEDAAGRPVGYVVLRRHRDGTTDVDEIALGAAAPAEPLARALFAAAAERAGPGTVRVHLPADGAVLAALPVLLAEAWVTDDRTGMARPLHATAAAVRATVTAPGAAHWYGDSF